MRNYSNKKLFGAFLVLGAMFFSTNAAAQETQVLVNTGNTDGKLGALSRPASVNKLETETADDFVLDQTTVLTGATITGLVTTSLANISNVEIEIYHRFPEDSIADRTPQVPTRQNSPSDVEIDSATRDGNNHTLRFSTALLNPTFTALKTVVNSISVAQGEPAVTGAEVEITVTFTSPIVLPAGHYFFRPEVQVNGGDFLFLSAPKPIVAPGQAIAGDLQAWIRNSKLSPDWLRIGADIIGGNPAPAFNMTFTLSGAKLESAGTPGAEDCHDVTISGLAHQFGSIPSAVSALGFSSVKSLQNSFTAFCGAE
jgi:hypothetical protein